MSSWQYVVFRTTGKRDAVLRRIKQWVRATNLSKVVPMVKFEPGRGKEFYLGVAIEFGESGREALLQQVLECLSHANLTNPIGDPGSPRLFDPKDVQRFLVQGVKWESFNEPITFEPWIEQPQDWVDDIQPRRDDLDPRRLDELVWWSSAKGRGTYAAFQDTALALGLVEMQQSTWQIARRLQLLGHLEIRDRLDWLVVPTCLVQTDTNPNRYFLSGAMVPSLTSTGALAGDLTVEHPRNSPSRWYLDGNGEPSAKSGVKVVRNAAANYADALASGGEWAAALEGDPDISAHNYLFDRIDIGAGTSERVDFNNQPGLYRVTRDAPNSRERVRLFDGERWVAGAYYDLQFLACKQASRPIAAHYGSDGIVTVPTVTRWPLAFEKALVLASGCLGEEGQLATGAHVLRYRGCSRALTRKICDRLGVELKEQA